MPRFPLFAFLVALLLGAGCGDGSSSATDTTVPPTSATSESTSSTEPTDDAAPGETTTTSSAASLERAPALDIQGHRGARGLRPENTLPAFEVALDAGVTTLELDLHFTADGQVVVWHDPTISGDKCEVVGSSGAALGIAVADLTRAELTDFRCAKNPDLGRFPDQTDAPTAIAGDDYSIVTLGELFEFVATYSDSAQKTTDQRANAARVRFNIETKRRPDQPETIGDGFDGETPGSFELAILDEVAANGLGDRVTIQSFDHRSLRAIRSVDPSIELAALTRRNEAFDDGFATFAQVWSPDYRSLSAAGLNVAQDAGMLVVPWTVNDPPDMNRLIDLGVDGIISDRPDLLVMEVAARS